MQVAAPETLFRSLTLKPVFGVEHRMGGKAGETPFVVAAASRFMETYRQTQGEREKERKRHAEAGNVSESHPDLKEKASTHSTQSLFLHSIFVRIVRRTDRRRKAIFPLFRGFCEDISVQIYIIQNSRRKKKRLSLEGRTNRQTDKGRTRDGWTASSSSFGAKVRQ